MQTDITRTARGWLRRSHRQLVFHAAMRRLLRTPMQADQVSDDALENLIYGWGNEGWSGTPEFLRVCIENALNCQAPILECGSGLSTIVLGVVAQRTGNSLWSLEHMTDWGARVEQVLRRFRIEAVRLCIAPLSRYGEYDWYTPPADGMPEHFGLVICDGPPSQTRGGRYGLVPQMRYRIERGCVILLDDAERPDEQVIVRRWTEELPDSHVVRGPEPRFVSVVVEDRSGAVRTLPAGRS